MILSLQTIQNYYQLTKPGIIYGNLLTTIGGFLFASKGAIDLFLLLSVVIGTSCVIGASCVFNNYTDREIDRRMSRTKKRALVTGEVEPIPALIFGGVLLLLGLSILFIFSNTLTAVIGFGGAISYVILYALGKRFTLYGTEIGSISGAMPIVGGYTAVTNQIDVAAVILFLIILIWQMPHFFSVALFRMKEYEAAHIPIAPLTRGVFETKILIVAYLLVFCLLVTSLTYFGYTTRWYMLGMGVLSLYWLFLGGMGFFAQYTNPWARKVFLFSLITLLSFSILISIDYYLPH